MNRALTIDELKELPIGDWVWLCDLAGDLFDNGYGNSTYVRKVFQCNEKIFECGTRGIGYGFNYSDYGKTWLAYKNKEQAECKGEIVELPCLRDKPTLFYHGEPILRKELNSMTDDGTICSVSYSEDEFAEAEHRLAELKGEKR